MKKLLYLLLSVLVVGTDILLAQLSAPSVENVYGGRISAIIGFIKAADTSRIIIATESANSLFYADVYTPSVGTPVFGAFNKVPGADYDNNFGSGIQNIAVHALSGYIFFGAQDGVYKVHPESGSAVKILNGGPAAILIQNSSLIILDGNKVHWGTVDASGNFTQDFASPLFLTIPPQPYKLIFNPYSERVHIFGQGNAPSLYVSSSIYSAFTAATTFAAVPLTSLSSSYFWSAFGVSGAGRYFVGGHDNNFKYVALSDDAVTWTTNSTSINGVSGNNFGFGRDTANYSAYFSTMYNNNKGAAGNWLGFGVPGGMETHPNDGSVFVDPNDDDIVYMTTDQGIGASTDKGVTIFEINDGVEAVQVDDFDMTSDKNTAWLASKAGIRKVTNYLTSPLWTNAIFPNNDGSPYYSAEMAAGDTNTVYVGNIRIYKTTNGGTNWNQVFSAENAPYNFNSVGPQVQAIEVCDFAPSLVMAGYYMEDSTAGGLFYSSDGGSNWIQILLESSVIGSDADVIDIVFNLEGSDTVAYIGVEYDLSHPTGRSVYKLTKSGTTWLVNQDMDAGSTSTGSLIVATIRDLHISSTGDTVFAAGTDAGINHPIAYYKPLNTSGLWTPFTTSGFPFIAGRRASAVTLGADTVYCAVDNSIYYLPLAASSWSLGYEYPVGTKINFLYYDDLLAGTGTGLYGHFGATTSGIGNGVAMNPSGYTLDQNYPNPFNPETTVRFVLEKNSRISFKVFNILGKEVLSLLTDVEFGAGEHSLKINTEALSSGIYFYELKTEAVNLVKKMTVLK